MPDRSPVSKRRYPSRDWPKRVLRYSRAKPTAKLVLLALAIMGDYYGETNSTKAELAVLLGVSPSVIKRSINSLLTLREIRIITRSGGRSQSARYQIIVKRGSLAKPLFKALKGGASDPLSSTFTHARA